MTEAAEMAKKGDTAADSIWAGDNGLVKLVIFCPKYIYVSTF